MKLSPLLIAAVILSIILILSIVLSTKGFVPYNPQTIYSNQSAYEGFHQMPKPLYYGTYPENKAIDQKDQFNIVNSASQATYQPLWGFGGLYGPPNVSDNNLDIYSKASGSLSEACHNSSSGLSNSMGYICMDKNQQQMLMTRGGNQTSCASQIGMGKIA